MTATRTVIITGGSSGLGYECARAISRHGGWHIILASRNPEQGDLTQLRNSAGSTSIETMKLDLGSLDSIRQFAQTLEERHLSIQALVCNAGIQFITGLHYTSDGFEKTFGVNHLGHFLLVNLLLKQMDAPARIVVVSSGTHNPDILDGRYTPPHYTSAHELAYPTASSADETTSQQFQLGMKRYTTSKLCNVFFAYELVRRLQTSGFTTPERPITVNVYDPGAVPGTGLTRDYGARLQQVVRVVGVFQPFLERLGINIHSVQSSGEAMARLVLDPELETTTGQYFQWRSQALSSKESYDLRKAHELWTTSTELAQLTSQDSPLQPQREIQQFLTPVRQ